MATVARLSLWLAPGQDPGALGAACERRLQPLLRRHGLFPSAERPRLARPGIHSRLFTIDSPQALQGAERALRRDPSWRTALAGLSPLLVPTAPGGPPRYRLGLYRTPAGPGETVEAGPGLRRGLWVSYGSGDGFPVATITAMMMDRCGHLWLCTEGMGVSRYDGAELTTYTTHDGLVLDTVACVAQDRQDRLWFGSGWMQGGAGACCYDGESFEVYTTEDGLADDTVFCLLVDRSGAVWMGTGGYLAGRGVSRWDGERFTTYTTQDGLGDDNVWSMVEDRDGRVWLGTLGGGVSRWDGCRFETLTARDGLARDVVLSLALDAAGHVWAGTDGGGACRWDGQRFTTLALADGLIHPRVLSLLADSAGRVWMGTYGGGLSRCEAGRFTGFTVEHGLANNQVRCLLEDPCGNLWVGTWTGVNRFDQGQLAHYDTTDGLVDDGVFTVMEDRRGRIWAGTFEGASCLDAGRFTTVSLPGPQFGEGTLNDAERSVTQESPGARGDVRSIVEDRQGGVWLAAAGVGAIRCDGVGFSLSSTDLGLADRSIFAILEDRGGAMWFVHRGGGVSRWDGQRSTTFTRRDGLVSSQLTCLLEDRHGHMWFGSIDAGVSRYDGEGFASFTRDDGLASDSIMGLLEDREGRLWFGGLGGVSRWDGEHFISFTRRDGLAHDRVLSILQDDRGVLWFGTFGGGISCWDGRVFQTLSRETGLVNDSVQRVIQARDGAIWVATEGGLTRYRPQRTPPEVRVTAVVADRDCDPAVEVRVPASQKLVVLQFRGRSWTTHPDRMAYRHRLLGFEQEWRQTSGRRAEYLDLPIGDYTFQVQAVDRDLNYSAPAEVCLKVVADPRLEGLSQALSGPAEEFVGSSPALRRVQQQLEQVAATDLTLLILGETGTGKGLAARSVHRLSRRASSPLIQVSCGALPEGLVESELFGHEKGAFTGATARRLGKVELAEGGTLFLDEIGDLSAAAQAKLLQVLEERTFSRVGGTRELTAEVRVIAATNRDLRRMVAEGAFREDLYFRLQEFQVELPPLRSRRQDIPVLASYFAARMAAHLDRPITGLEPAALEALEAYPWPGNVRELEHVVRRAVVVCAGQVIRRRDLFLGGSGNGPQVEPRGTLDEVERGYILEVLNQTGWVIKGPGGAARILGLPPSSLYERMHRLGIERPTVAAR